MSRNQRKRKNNKSVYEEKFRKLKDVPGTTPSAVAEELFSECEKRRADVPKEPEVDMSEFMISSTVIDKPMGETFDEHVENKHPPLIQTVISSPSEEENDFCIVPPLSETTCAQTHSTDNSNISMFLISEDIDLPIPPPTPCPPPTMRDVVKTRPILSFDVSYVTYREPTHRPSYDSYLHSPQTSEEKHLLLISTDTSHGTSSTTDGSEISIPIPSMSKVKAVASDIGELIMRVPGVPTTVDYISTTTENIVSQLPGKSIFRKVKRIAKLPFKLYSNYINSLSYE